MNIWKSPNNKHTVVPSDCPVKWPRWRNLVRLGSCDRMQFTESGHFTCWSNFLFPSTVLPLSQHGHLCCLLGTFLCVPSLQGATPSSVSFLFWLTPSGRSSAWPSLPPGSLSWLPYCGLSDYFKYSLYFLPLWHLCLFTGLLLEGTYLLPLRHLSQSRAHNRYPINSKGEDLWASWYLFGCSPCLKSLTSTLHTTSQKSLNLPLNFYCVIYLCITSLWILM